MAEHEIKAFTGEADLKVFVQKNYFKQIKNYFSDEQKALKFMSSMIADTQRNPKLLECTPVSLINSYMTMAQMGFMPSAVSGEGYVLPYKNNKKVGKDWVTTIEAQFQIGYQGLVTLFYQAGVEKITSDIVRKNDKTSYINGELLHEIDLGKSNAERGEPVGAYVTITFRGVKNTKYMNATDILAHGKKFSKSFNPTGEFSPWNPINDPELHMWRKTVLKQLAKNVPKNENINRAIALDNRDSVIADRVEEAKGDTKALTMGHVLGNDKATTDEETFEADAKSEAGAGEDQAENAGGDKTPTVTID